MRAKLFSNLFFTDNLYLTGGIDYLGKKPKPLVFFGLGINFTDDDLKSLIATAGAVAVFQSNFQDSKNIKLFFS